MTGDEWRWVVGFEGRYQISDSGGVYSLLTHKRLRTDFGRKYEYAVLRDVNGKGHTLAVHRMVLEAFVGPRPEGMATRHLNGDVHDNRITNLVYGFYSENARDTIDHGNHGPSNRTHCPAGHPYSGDNLMLRRNGNRLCRECNRARSRKYRASRREMDHV